ncbi:hypothetical protein MUK42_33264 [Musa troglodytarum]|uniref:Uncharacterized protein n=1 Tax=Musa troglodytarum TaxID=320322 RepID=A0A9E7L3D6_9LILI|nr:hypothetical protein MUK42_33264 [Musa troglodytarum]
MYSLFPRYPKKSPVLRAHLASGFISPSFFFASILIPNSLSISISDHLFPYITTQPLLSIARLLPPPTPLPFYSSPLLPWNPPRGSRHRFGLRLIDRPSD